MLTEKGGGTVGYDTLRLRTGGEGNIANVMRKNGRFLMDMEIENDVSAAPDIFICEGTTPEKPLTIRMYENKYSAANGFTVKFSVKIGDSLKIGDLLYDCNENVYWVCKDSHKNAGIYCSGTLLRCIEMPLKWQDDKGNIFEYPVFDYSQFASDVTDFRILNVGDGKHRLVIIADENTIRLGHDKRFFWGRNREKPSVFRLTQNDSTTMFYDKGLIKLTLSEDQYNPETDDIVQWLCDYKKSVNNGLALNFGGNNFLRIGGIKRVWAETKGTVNLDITADSRISFENAGNSVKIACPLDENLIGQKVVICASAGDQRGECEFEIIGGV